MLVRVIVFILSLGLGLAILKYTLQWVDNVGKSEWVETKIGIGASYTMWKILAVAIIVFGFLILIGEVSLFPSFSGANNPNSADIGLQNQTTGNNLGR